LIINEKGDRFVAEFPEGVNRPIQYGNQLRTHTVYLGIGSIKHITHETDSY
jgi:hypothetical protein